jgi:hypothetical protein
VTQVDIRLKCNSVIAALFVGLAAGPLELRVVDETPDSIDPKRVRVLSRHGTRELCDFVAFEDGHGGAQLSLVGRSAVPSDEPAITAVLAGIEALAKGSRYFRGPVGFRPPSESVASLAGRKIGG